MTRLWVKVVPKSNRREAKLERGSLKVWLKSAPENGAANHELCLFLAKKLDIPRVDIKIFSGFSSRNKVVDISGISLEEIEKSIV